MVNRAYRLGPRGRRASVQRAGGQHEARRRRSGVADPVQPLARGRALDLRCLRRRRRERGSTSMTSVEPRALGHDRRALDDVTPRRVRSGQAGDKHLDRVLVHGLHGRPSGRAGGSSRPSRRRSRGPRLGICSCAIGRTSFQNSQPSSPIATSGMIACQSFCTPMRYSEKNTIWMPRIVWKPSTAQYWRASMPKPATSSTRGRDGGRDRGIAARRRDVVAGERGGDVGDREDEGDDRGDRDDARALARRERLQVGADLVVAGAAAGVAAAHARRRGGGRGRGRRAGVCGRRRGAARALALARARSLTARSRPAAPRAALRPRRADRRPRRSRARRRSGRAPAVTTSSTLPASIPPIAKNGTGAWKAAKRTSSTPTGWRPGLRRRRVDRPDADVVDLGRGVDLVGEVRRLPDERIRAGALARGRGLHVVLPDVAAVGARRLHERGWSLRISSAPASSHSAPRDRAAATARSADAPLSRSWTMSTPPASAGRARRRAPGRPDRGRRRGRGGRPAGARGGRRGCPSHPLSQQAAGDSYAQPRDVLSGVKVSGRRRLRVPPWRRRPRIGRQSEGAERRADRVAVGSARV